MIINMLLGPGYTFEMKCASTTTQMCGGTRESRPKCGRVVGVEPRSRAPPVSLRVILRTSDTEGATELLLELTAQRTLTGKLRSVSPGERLPASCSTGMKEKLRRVKL